MNATTLRNNRLQYTRVQKNNLTFQQNMQGISKVRSCLVPGLQRHHGCGAYLLAWCMGILKKNGRRSAQASCNRQRGQHWLGRRAPSVLKLERVGHVLVDCAAPVGASLLLVLLTRKPFALHLEQVDTRARSPRANFSILVHRDTNVD